MNGKPVFTVPSKTVLNLKSGFQKKQLCDGPTFTAGTSCAYSCSFCYVEAVMGRGLGALKEQGVEDFQGSVIRRDKAISVLTTQLLHRTGKPRYKDPEDRRVVYASPLVDVAANMELVRETVAMCKLILEHTHWQIRLLSKSNLLPKVAAELTDHQDRMIYGVSTGTLDDSLAKAFEKGCPNVSKRIESLHALQDAGCRTYGMICPSLPQHDYVAFSRDILKAIRADRCEHIWAEVINVRGESFTRTHDALVAGGCLKEAAMVKTVSEDKDEWESYARETYCGHAFAMKRAGMNVSEKLKFLQYVTNSNKHFWAGQPGVVEL